MDELRALYQEVILDHYKRPRHFGVLADADQKAHGQNPLCGDQVTVYVKTNEDGDIEDISFEGVGCAISTASASLMTEAVAGKSRDEAEALVDAFHHLVTDDRDAIDPDQDLGKLEVLSGVREFPVRIKCATLAWHALRAALEGRGEPVTTE